MMMVQAMLLKIKMSSSHLKATSHVGDSAVKARPKRETRDVELYTRTAVWEEDIIVEIIFGMSLPSHVGAVYPPGHQRPEQHGDEEAEGVAGHDEGAGGGNVDCLRGHCGGQPGGAAQVGVGDLRDKDGS